VFDLVTVGLFVFGLEMAIGLRVSNWARIRAAGLCLVNRWTGASGRS